MIVRPFNNYGPRQHPEKVIPRFITQALDDEPLTVHGDGCSSRDWLYVDDDAEAIEAIVAAPLDAVAGEVLNVATGIDISVRDERGLPTASSTLSAISSTAMSMPVATFTTSPAIRSIGVSMMASIASASSST